MYRCQEETLSHGNHSALEAAHYTKVLTARMSIGPIAYCTWMGSMHGELSELAM